MLKIRLQRIGRRNDPAFRVVVTESTRGPKSNKHVEQLGSYDPRQDTSTLNADRIRYWISHGAQVSGTVHNLLVHENVIEGAKINVLPRKSPIVKEQTEGTTESELPAEAGGSEESAASEEGQDAGVPAGAPSPKTDEKLSQDEMPKEPVGGEEPSSDDAQESTPSASEPGASEEEAAGEAEAKQS